LRGYTLVELLTATLLALVLMYAVVRIFAAVGEQVNDSRNTLDMTDRLRATKIAMQRDLAGATVRVFPPRRSEDDDGYIEIIEGPLGTVVLGTRVLPGDVARNTDDPANVILDTTVGDMDDVLLMTVRSRTAPFIGRYGTTTLESHEAEIAWFVRGRTLYRRVLLIAPQTLSALDANGNGVIDSSPQELNGAAFHALYDISARPEFDNTTGAFLGWVPNTLGDLAKRENRYAHRVLAGEPFPYDARKWGRLGLPTLEECSHPYWMFGSGTGWAAADIPAIPDLVPGDTIDLWNAPHPWAQANALTGTWTSYQQSPPVRIAEDVVLPYVLVFNIQVRDPGAPRVAGPGGTVVVPGDPGYTAGPSPGSLVGHGAYVDLGYDPSFSPPPQAPQPHFARPNYDFPPPGPRSGLVRIYDTWSFQYEHDGRDQFPLDARPGDLGTDGFDNPPLNGLVDELTERETRPPYPFPLRGIKITIVSYDPDSRQVRKVTIVHDFQ
jgi:type II secretory pathway component PulJ